jgi:hypothetical protein
MPDDTPWVLLAYRLPREPSTPRITLWRKLRQLGALQLLDGLVGLPHTPATREQLEWLADGVLEAGGDATIWLAHPAAAAQRRDLVRACINAREEEYRAVVEAAAAGQSQNLVARHRTLLRLRRELRRLRARDYFDAPGRRDAEAAVEALATPVEVHE